MAVAATEAVFILAGALAAGKDRKSVLSSRVAMPSASTIRTRNRIERGGKWKSGHIGCLSRRSLAGYLPPL
jgi:hypothetical protein